MKNYEYTEKCREISGFGGEYEKACRDMVKAGMEWLDQNPEAEPTFAQSKKVIGLTIDENEDMQKMQSVMVAAVGGCSGAMMQAATNHVLYARKNGWEKYIQEMEMPAVEEGEGAENEEKN